MARIRISKLSKLGLPTGRNIAHDVNSLTKPVLGQVTQLDRTNTVTKSTTFVGYSAQRAVNPVPDFYPSPVVNPVPSSPVPNPMGTGIDDDLDIDCIQLMLEMGVTPKNIGQLATLIRDHLGSSLLSNWDDNTVYQFWVYGLGRVKNISDHNIQSNNGYGEIRFPKLWIKKGLTRLVGDFLSEQKKKLWLENNQQQIELDRAEKHRLDMEANKIAWQEALAAAERRQNHSNNQSSNQSIKTTSSQSQLQSQPEVIDKESVVTTVNQVNPVVKKTQTKRKYSSSLDYDDIDDYYDNDDSISTVALCSKPSMPKEFLEYAKAHPHLRSLLPQ